MAKKKAKAKKPSGKFLVLHSSCGDLNQLQCVKGSFLNNNTVRCAGQHPTKDAALAEAAAYADYNAGEVGTFVIAEILEVGKADANVTWGKEAKFS